MEKYYIAAAIVLGLILFIVYLLYMNKQFKHQTEMSRMQMELMKEFVSKMGSDRVGIEKQIYSLNNKMTSDERKWKEMNHLLLNAMSNNVALQNTKSEVTSFIERFGLSSTDIGKNKDTIFVLTPFNPEMSYTYRIIANACSKEGFKVMRGDENYVESNILSHIIEMIVKSRIVVVNLTGRNPNVLYELGIAHTINKPTILISKSIDDVPFDIKDRRVIIYSNEKELNLSLRKTIKQLLIDSKNAL